MTSSKPDPEELPNSDNQAGRRPRAEKLVLLSTFSHSHEAQMLCNKLEQHGITATIANELTTPLFGGTIAGASSAFWIEVLVLESDAEKALEIKNQLLDSDENVEDEIPAWTCECGETVDAGFAICWKCNADYKRPDNVG